MANGVVKRVVLDKGFGFIRESSGEKEYFFHRSSVKPHSSAFDTMQEGDNVRFEPGTGPKGPRAEEVFVD